MCCYYKMDNPYLSPQECDVINGRPPEVNTDRVEKCDKFISSCGNQRSAVSGKSDGHDGLVLTFQSFDQIDPTRSV